MGWHDDGSAEQEIAERAARRRAIAEQKVRIEEKRISDRSVRTPMATQKMFYVAMSKKQPDRAFASCVDEPTEKWGKAVLKEFYRDNAGYEIRHVDGDEMVRLMSLELSEPK